MVTNWCSGHRLVMDTLLSVLVVNWSDSESKFKRERNPLTLIPLNFVRKGLKTVFPVKYAHLQVWLMYIYIIIYTYSASDRMTSYLKE